MNFEIQTGPSLSDLSKPSKKLQDIIQEATNSNSAIGMYERIVNLINEFESDLDNEYEAGARLVSFGQSIQFHIIDVGYWSPNLIIFYGALDDGSRVQLVQHMSQLSFLLIAIKRQNPNQPRRIIGFCDQNEEESNQACDQSAATSE